MKFLRTGGWEGGLCGRVLKVGGYGGPEVRVGGYAGPKFEGGSLKRRRWRRGI